MSVFECTSVIDGANVTTCQLLMTTQTVSSCQSVCAGVADCMAMSYRVPDWDPPQCTFFDNTMHPSFAAPQVSPRGGTCDLVTNGQGCCSVQPPGTISQEAS